MYRGEAELLGATEEGAAKKGQKSGKTQQVAARRRRISLWALGLRPLSAASVAVVVVVVVVSCGG